MMTDMGAALRKVYTPAFLESCERDAGESVKRFVVRLRIKGRQPQSFGWWFFFAEREMAKRRHEWRP